MNRSTAHGPRVAVWVFGVVAVLLSTASAFSYFMYMGQGIAIGDMIGVPGRQGDIALAQHWAAVWLRTCAICLGGSIATGTLALPLYPDASPCRGSLHVSFLPRSSQWFSRGGIGIVAFSMITAFH